MYSPSSARGFWRLSYKVITNTQSPESTAQNTRSLSYAELSKISVTDVHNSKYDILQWNGYDGFIPKPKAETFGIVLSQRVFMEDMVRVNNVVKNAVAANLNGKVNLF